MKEENISRDLDKFYTHPEISKRFVENIKSHVSFDDMDIILEPSAGCGNISKCLPEDAVSIDLVPEGDGIIQQDFFDYFPVGLEPYSKEDLFQNSDFICNARYWKSAFWSFWRIFKAIA